jgi:hypothetical protein
MTRTARLLAFSVAFLMALAVATASPSARARISVMAVDSEVTVSDSLATAKFKIQVTNQDETAMTSVHAVFAGGFEVAMSDVAAGATVTSASQKLVFNAADLVASKNVPVPVTLKYVTDGVEQSASAVLVLRRAE